MREPEPSGREDAAPAGRAWQTSVALDGAGTDIAQARHLAADFLARGQAERGLKVSRRGLDLTQLVVSELVTNVCKYAPGPALMNLRVDGDVVEVTVWDSAPVLPVARGADAGRVGQHGLEIVMTVAQDFEARLERFGKSVTARIALTDDPADTPQNDRH
ncbi:ATP-binding protein [Streptomyces sp. 378]|uniref:ATP-binding protein n=1 Tax=Streptomyces sp. 378 TaxID=3049412 RepID=UPI0024C393F6|nr:ATP-binding protein [Streptomyces sp. 378]MDK1348179.1 ATP-binding protein [Streptomyces sp. 378]